MSDLTFKYLHTTEKKPQETASEIMKLLCILGANNISMQMQDNEIAGMQFAVVLGEQEVHYKLPIRWQPVFETMKREKDSKRKRRSYNEVASDEAVKQQAKRTAWRLVQEWLKIQVAYVQTGVRHPAEVFLADMIIPNPDGGMTTVGERLMAKGAKGLLLGYTGKNG